MRAAWNLLYGYGADLILNGHDHDYERYSPQDPYGNYVPSGLREFVSGTGGKSAREGRTQHGNSERLIEGRFGVLKLNLKPKSYNWQFLPTDAGASDSGSAECH